MFISHPYDKKYVKEDVYSLVKSGEWTLEKASAVAGDVYEDIDGVEGRSGEDNFSIALDWKNADGLMMSTGYRLLDKSTGENFFAESSYFDGEAKNAFDDMLAFVNKDSVWVESRKDKSAENSFNSGAAAIYIGPLSGSSKFNRDGSVVFGIAPLPVNEKGEKTTTSLISDFTLYSISGYSKDPELAAAILQTMGCFGETETAPVVFEYYIKSRSGDGAGDRDMMKIISDGVCFDSGKLFDGYLSKYSEVVPAATINITEWSKTYNAVVKSGLKKDIKALNVKLGLVIG